MTGLWIARIMWALLPVTTGGACSDALESWSTAPARVATILLWGAWAIGLLALFAPRPWGLTALRVIAPLGTVAVIVCAFTTSAANAVLAVVGVLAAAALALSAPVATASAQALAYGDERRYPLRVPTPLLLGPVPLGVLLVGAALTGPLFLADGRLALGIPITVVGAVVVLLVARSLHALSKRWLVFVPAGIAVVDPLTLAEPVLVRREAIAQLVRAPGTTLPSDALDLRLGTLAGGIGIELSEGVEFSRRRGRGAIDVIAPSVVAVAVMQRERVLSDANGRRIAVR